MQGRLFLLLVAWLITACINMCRYVQHLEFGVKHFAVCVCNCSFLFFCHDFIQWRHQEPDFHRNDAIAEEAGCCGTWLCPLTTGDSECGCSDCKILQPRKRHGLTWNDVECGMLDIYTHIWIHLITIITIVIVMFFLIINTTTITITIPIIMIIVVVIIIRIITITTIFFIYFQYDYYHHFYYYYD